jgi:hypothetical protein
MVDRDAIKIKFYKILTKSIFNINITSLGWRKVDAIY